MRVCILTSSYPRFEGDIAGGFIRDLCDELVRRGTECVIVAPGDEEPRGANSSPGLRVVRFRYCAPRRLQRLAYGAGMEENLSAHPSRWLLLPIFLASFIFHAWRETRRCDLVWSHWLLPAGLVGAIVSRLRGLPHCTTVHSRPPATACRLMLPLLARRTAMTAVNRGLGTFLAEAAGTPLDDIRVIPMGIPITSPARRESKADLKRKCGLGDAFVILFMGRLVRIKGLETLVEAARGLSGTTLLIAGEGPCETDLRALARTIDIPVRFEGFLSGKKKLEWLSLCDIFALPSVTLKGGRSEGTPVGLIEALASGAAVVASNSGGIPELIDNGRNGLLVPPGDTAALARALRTLRNDPRLRARFSAAARESAMNYSIERVADEFEAVFKGCLEAESGISISM